ncbi:MFS transporter [Kutzneria sp. 744]|uniref:MFS transporter n=1 Tax=Kutzneria sp. (strain 744) TaxID=345341 RepID=UPI0003EED47D|nr:MFS transporter [Kutzneria sp. 744]EWM19074.1 major facilitator superfamily transporter [Kutzneria sp. 744]
MTATATPLATVRNWIGLAVILAATFMGQVDGFIVVIAAPSIQRDLPASFWQIQLVGAAYVLACAAGLITGGRLGDRHGRRRVFLLGVAVFTLASLVCGLAPTAPTLIAARFAQGIGAAALIPQELALIRGIFLDDAQRAKAIRWYGVVLGFGVIFGLAGGGLLVHWDLAGLGWRTAFLINVPIGALILAFGSRTVAETRVDGSPALDLVGAGLTALALPALLLPLILGQQTGWIWLSLPIGVVLAAILFRQQRSRREPLFPIPVLTAPGLPAGLAAIGTFFAGNAGLFLIFTYYLQTGLDRDALTAGLMFVPLGIGFVAGSAASGRVAARFGKSLPTAGCLFLAAVLTVQLAVVHAQPDAQTALLGIAIGVVGLAQGLVVSPLIAGIFDRISPADAGAVSGAASTVTQIGLASGFAAVGSWYQLFLDGDDTLGGQVFAYSASILVLVVLAVVTSLLCARREPNTTPERPV